MVMVMAGGEIQQKIFTLNETFNQEQLSEAAAAITQSAQGMILDSIQTIRPF